MKNRRHPFSAPKMFLSVLLFVAFAANSEPITLTFIEPLAFFERVIQERRDVALMNPELWERLFAAKDLRNTVVHEYFNPDPAILWTTVETILPGLRASILGFSRQAEDPDNRAAQDS